MHVVAQHTIEVVRARHLLPRWDLATHLGHGWLDYHLLITGQIHRLLWDLWLQGYWPPGLSLYLLPFYGALGGDMTSGLWSSTVAFVLIGITGSVLLWRQLRQDALLPAAVFIALMTSSPFLLAYATVAMTEMLGGLAQLLVLLCCLRYRQHPSSRTARLVAISLAALFFIKYNYFFLLAAPLAIHEWLERTSGRGVSDRLAGLWRWLRRALSSPTGAFLALYSAALLVVVGTGGIQFQLLGSRVSIRSVGTSGVVVVYILLARVWYLHGRGRIDWRRLTSVDLRIRPLLLWFVAPVTVWFASPYPNHVRDFANLTINLPLGDPTIVSGVATYLDALRTAYFYSPWLLVFVGGAFLVATSRYRRQPPLMQWLILAVLAQLAAIALHHTRFARFLLLPVVLLCLAAAGEVGRWFARAGALRIAAGLLAPIVIAGGVIATRFVVREDRFRRIAFEHYTDSEPLRRALEAVRHDLHADDRLIIAGETDQLSPALFRWELGPPSGLPCFPFPIGGAGRLDPALATRVLVISRPGSELAPIDVSPTRVAELRDLIQRGDLVLLRDVPLPDLQAVLRLYGRSVPPRRPVSCA